MKWELTVRFSEIDKTFSSSNNFRHIVHRNPVDGTKIYSKRYYLSQKFRSDWMGAFMFCKKHDMELVTLEDSDAASYFFTLVLNYFKAQTKFQRAFVGAMTSQPGSTTEWYWIHRGVAKKTSFPLQWHENEPNRNGEEFCLEVSLRRTWWIIQDRTGFNDVACFDHTKNDDFICQQIIA